MAASKPTDCDPPELTELLAVVRAARAFLRRIDDMTTEDFANGGDKPERDALRASLASLDDRPL